MNEGVVCSIPKRFHVIMLLALGMLVVHVMRTNLGMAEVAIVDSFHLKTPEEMQNTSFRPSGVDVLSGPNVGFLNSAMYIGLVLLHIPAGFLTLRFETRWCFLFGAFLSATVNNFVPLMLENVISVRYKDAVMFFWCTVFLRILQGMFEAVLMPACYQLMGKWIPQTETSRFGSLVFSGVYGGAILGFLLGGFVISWDWRAIFWLSSAMVYIWCILFTLVVHESPLHHPTIQESETKLIHDGYRLNTSGKVCNFIFCNHLDIYFLNFRIFVYHGVIFLLQCLFGHCVSAILHEIGPTTFC